MRGRDVALWVGLLAGPILWFTNLEAQFALAPWICAWNWRVAPGAIAIVTIVLIATSGALSWRQLQGAEPAEASTEAARSRAMALAGIVLSAGFLTVVLAQAIPQFMMSGCE